MKTPVGLFLTVCLGLMIVGCVNTHAEKKESSAYKRGYKQGSIEAKEEIETDKMTVYVYGLRVGSPDGKDVHQETGLPCKAIAGCIVSDEILGRAAGHNRVIFSHVKKDSN